MWTAPVTTEPASETLPAGVSIVVPVYRGRGTIEDLHRQVAEEFERRGDEWELIFVDDSSPDGSWAVISEICQRDPRVRGIQMSRNYGQHAALLAGIRAARMAFTVTMDDDLQHRPDQIGRLLDVLDDDTDLVYGQSVDEEHAPWRNITSRLAKWVLSATIGADQARETSAFRAFRTALRDGWRRVTDPFVSIDVLLSWTTTHHRAVTVQMDERLIGTSNYTFRSLARHMVNMLTGYSTRPLRLVAWLGLVASLFGFAVLVYVIVQYFRADARVPGFAFLASLVAMLGGMQLFGLGVIGEYLGRMHVRSMDRPTYMVRRTIRAADDGAGTVDVVAPSVEAT
jgi:glycosyltransferase involved in cell wall biosynthesis